MLFIQFVSVFWRRAVLVSKSSAHFHRWCSKYWTSFHFIILVAWLIGKRRTNSDDWVIRGMKRIIIFCLKGRLQGHPGGGWTTTIQWPWLLLPRGRAPVSLKYGQLASDGWEGITETWNVPIKLVSFGGQTRDDNDDKRTRQAPPSHPSANPIAALLAAEAEQLISSVCPFHHPQQH